MNNITVARPDIMVVSVGAQGPPGVPGPTGGGSVDTAFDKVAGEDVSAYRAVVPSGSTNVLLATNTNSAHRNAVLGVTEQAASTGGSVRVRRAGRIDFAGWAWTPNAPIFVGASGTLTQVPPVSPAVFVQVIGFALSATAMFVWPREPVSIL
jgi:hypothetical protein